jgi:hypothetical protein
MPAFEMCLRRRYEGKIIKDSKDEASDILRIDVDSKEALISEIARYAALHIDDDGEWYVGRKTAHNQWNEIKKDSIQPYFGSLPVQPISELLVLLQDPWPAFMSRSYCPNGSTDQF